MFPRSPAESQRVAQDVFVATFALQLFAQLLDHRQVPERFHAPDNPPLTVSEDSRGNADRPPVPGSVQNGHGLADHRRARLDRLPESALPFADVGAKDVAA